MRHFLSLGWTTTHVGTIVKSIQIISNFTNIPNQVSEFKSNILKGLVWPLRGLTQKGKGMNVSTALPWHNYVHKKNWGFHKGLQWL
jgi:hypothetical protein